VRQGLRVMNDDQKWNFLGPTCGRSGGMLIGVRDSSMEVLHIAGGDYHIKLHIRNRADNFTWSLVTVYGAAQTKLKPAFST
jgi:hypothetical protein